MKTTIHTYCFDTKNPEQKAEYHQLCARLANYPHKMQSHDGGKSSHYRFVEDINGQEIELETTHLFSNQWNTAPIPGKSDLGLRVFDWAEDYPIDFSPSIKRGHYLDQTDEMREIRRNTIACRYCGKQEPAAKGYVLCPHCIDSEYLEKSYVYLTRMLPIDHEGSPLPLTEAESEYFVTLWKQAQLVGTTERGKARLAKFRKDIETVYEKTTRAAQRRHDGFLWLLDHGMTTQTVDNCIYCDHVDRFSFGWRKPVDADTLSALLNVLTEFPYRYEIKTEDGRTLQNE